MSPVRKANLLRIARVAREFAAACAGPQSGWRKSRGVLVLTYHRILPDDHPDREYEQPGMYVSPDTFRHQIEWLVEHGFEPVRLQDWVTRSCEPLGRATKHFAITFDDGWQDNFEYAFPVLEKYRIPATVFVVTGIVDTTRDLWPGRLGRLIRRFSAYAQSDGDGVLFKKALHEISNFQIDHTQSVVANANAAIEKAKFSNNDEQIRCKLDEIEKLIGIGDKDGTRRFLAWDEIRTMTQSGLIDIGSHTRTHRRLCGEMTSKQLTDELLGSQSAIEKRTGIAPVLFCYPNGDVLPQAEQVVRQNYKGACTTARGWNADHADPYELRRISIHDDATKSARSFAAKLSGWY